MLKNNPNQLNFPAGCRISSPCSWKKNLGVQEKQYFNQKIYGTKIHLGRISLSILLTDGHCKTADYSQNYLAHLKCLNIFSRGRHGYFKPVFTRSNQISLTKTRLVLVFFLCIKFNLCIYCMTSGLLQAVALILDVLNLGTS